MFTDNLKSRGYLPHFDRTGYVHTVRCSQVDVVPPCLRSATTPNPYGSCQLRIPNVAELVVASLKFQDKQGHIELYAYVVMPNHIHLLARFHDPIEDVMGRFKSFTGKEINALRHQTGKFWQRDYFDRWVSSDDEFRRAKSYIEFNPVRAGLCDSPADWPYSSAIGSTPR